MGLEAPPTMDTSTVHTLCDRLSSSSEVEQNLPWSLRSKAEGATHDEKRAHLQGLLERDAALFLEKYGGSLSGAELTQFEVLKGDYEVNWHLNRLSGDLSPSPQQEKARAAQVKNRRLAYMQRLEDEGSFFSEDAMRERAPLLHEQFMGRQPTSSEPGGRQPVVPRPGEGLSELVLRQAKEDHIAARLKRERADFEKEAAEESAAAIAAQSEDREEVDEEPSAKIAPPTEAPPHETPSEPTGPPGLPAPRVETGGTARTVSGRKGPRVRFGVISGASVAGSTGATSAGTGVTSAVPAVGFEGKGAEREALGIGTDPQEGATTTSPVNERQENPGVRASEVLQNEAGPIVGGEISGGRTKPSAFESPVKDSNPRARSVNTRSSDGAGRGENSRRSVKPAGGNESEEKVTHARFGEFTTPEPVSASRIASQVVRRVLESATADRPRHPVTRFGEIPEPGFGEASSPAGVSGRQNAAGPLGRREHLGLPESSGRRSGSQYDEGLYAGSAGTSNRGDIEVSEEGFAGVSAGLAGDSNGAAAVGERRRPKGAADGGPEDGGMGIRDGRRIKRDETRGIGDGSAGIGDGVRDIGDGGAEEMDTDEEDLGSRTHTDASELGGDLVDVDSRPQGQIAEFRRVMKERFLEGNDEEHVDYGAIDGDTKLDDDWLGEVDRDAQEKYFDED